ncbi:MAG: VOC family protein [Acetobacteraceae bacterium]
MFDHVALRVGDIPASIRFHETVLGPLGFILTSSDESTAGFGRPKATAAPWLHRQQGGTGSAVHLAFIAPGRSAVERFHAGGIKVETRDHGRPGLRSDYGASYYAAFLLDPAGNNVEAVVQG